MRLKFLLFVILLIALPPIFAQLKHEETPEEHELKHDLSLKYIFLFGGILVVTFIRHLFNAYDVSMPYNVFCVIIGMFWGVGALYSKWMHDMAAMTETLLKNITSIYIPAIIFSTGFCIDVHAFIKSLPQILILSAPVALLSSMASGLLMRLVIDPSWQLTDAVIFGFLSLAVYPTNVFRWLMGSNSHTKHVRILLEGEALLSASVSLVTFNLSLSSYYGWVVKWYQFVALISRIFGLAIPVGYLYGLLGSFLMRLAYNDAVGLMLLTITTCYTGYFFIRWVSHGGIIGTITVSIVMGLERASLSNEMEKLIINLWEMIVCVMNAVVFINIGVMTPSLLENGLSFSDYILVLVTYLVTNITRFLSFFLFSPILSRIGYGMSFQNMVICVWSGLKNPICLDLVLSFYGKTYKHEPKKAKIFFLHVVGVYLLFLFINGSCVPVLMKGLGLAQISVSRLINMNNCLKHIYEARARTVVILKMDRFLSDANWPLVMASTALKHPYKAKLQVTEGQEEEEDHFLGNKYTFCPDCQKDVLNEPTPKEMKDMTREAKLRILKLKKMAYSRQYENGMMSQEGIRILHQAVEVAMDDEELEIELEGLFRLFTKEGIFYRFLRNWLQYFLRTSDEDYRPPRKPWRLTCYRIVNHIAFYIFINAIVILHLAMVIFHIFDASDGNGSFIPKLTSNSNNFFFCIYLIEFWLKIFALSWIYICKHGFYTYFHSYWNVFEFTILIVTFIASLLHGVIEAFVDLGDLIVLHSILIIVLGIRTFRLLSLLKMFACCRTLTPTVIKYLDAQIDSHRTLAYELSKNYAAGEEEILKNLYQIVDNDKIREDVKQKIEKDRLAVTRRLGLAQKEWPCVAITVKTKLAMNTLLNKMREDVQELKVSGWVDDVEFSKLLRALSERYSYVKTIETIQPSSPKMIFRELPYIGNDEELIEFLYTNMTTKKFGPGDVVVKDGEILEDVYILIKGMFLVTYTPTPEVIERLQEVGALPVISYISSMTYEEPLREYVVPGNSIGEISILTGRPYNGTVVAETQSHVFVLNKNILQKAFEQDDDPVNGLECRVWKYVGFRRAFTVMLSIPSYRSYSQEKIKFILESSFMPNLSNYKVFVVNEMMEDIILIEGVVVDFNTRDVYTGPCYIPRAVQKLVLPKSSFVNIEVPVETKLLVIPAKDYDEYEIMVTEEETCELVNDDSAKCLLHLIQEKNLLSSTSSRAMRIKSALSGAKKRLLGIDTTKSRISAISSKTSKN